MRVFFCGGRSLQLSGCRGCCAVLSDQRYRLWSTCWQCWS